MTRANPRRRSLALVAGAAFCAVASQPAAALDRLPAGLAALDPAHFAERVDVQRREDGALVLSTANGWTGAHDVKGAHARDIHLRAVLAPSRSGQAIQVWHELVYEGSHLDFRTATLEVGGRRHVLPLSGVEHWEEDCPGPDSVGRCNLHSRISVDLPVGMAREIAATWPGNGRVPARIRFEDPHGNTVTSGLAPAEVAGLLKAFDVHGG